MDGSGWNLASGTYRTSRGILCQASNLFLLPCPYVTWNQLEGKGDVYFGEEKIWGGGRITVFRYLQSCYVKEGLGFFYLAPERNTRNWVKLSKGNSRSACQKKPPNTLPWDRLVLLPWRSLTRGQMTVCLTGHRAGDFFLVWSGPDGCLGNFSDSVIHLGNGYDNISYIDHKVVVKTEHDDRRQAIWKYLKAVSA